MFNRVRRSREEAINAFISGQRRLGNDPSAQSVERTSNLGGYIQLGTNDSSSSHIERPMESTSGSVESSTQTRTRELELVKFNMLFI